MTTQLVAAYATAIVTILGAVGALIVTIRSHQTVMSNAQTMMTNAVTAHVMPRIAPAIHVLATGLRIMYDGINADAGNIRAVFQPGNMVCYYVAGNSFIWTPAEKAMFPANSLVGITLTASYTGPGSDVLDVENGGASPDQVKTWIEAKHSAGYAVPTIYASKSIIPTVVAAAHPFVAGTDYDLWVADWDGNESLPWPAAAAKQFRNAGPYDVSVIFKRDWPVRSHVTPPPPPPPPVIPLVNIRDDFPVRLDWPLVADADHYVVTWGIEIMRPNVNTTVMGYKPGKLSVVAIVHGKSVPVGEQTFP